LAKGFTKATLASVAELANGWLPPQNLSAVPSDSEITVNWDAAPETTRYKLFKNNVLLTETEETSYIDTDVVNGTEYIYYVKGIHSGSGEESPESNRDCIAASPPLTLPYFNDFEENTNGWRTSYGWELISTQHYSGNNSLTTGTIYQNYFSTAELCWFSIPDTTTNISFSFYFKGNIHGKVWGKQANGFIEISTDRKKWNKLIKLTGNFYDWNFIQIPLNQYIGETFVQVRIRVESSGEDIEGDQIAGRLFFDDTNIDFIFSPKPIPENLRIVPYSENPKIVKLEWDNITIPVNGYNMYKNHIKINDALIPSSFCYDNSPSPDDCYQVTAVYLDMESGFSNEACIKDVGIKEIIPFSAVKIIPNPSNGMVNIETGLSTDYHLAIYTMLGIKVFQKESFTEGILDLSHLPKGMYILKITTKDDSVAKKVVLR
jgi:hypothetical protein